MDFSDYRNLVFDDAAWHERLLGLLRDLAVQTTGAGWSVSEADLRVMEQAEALAVQAISGYFQRLREMARCRSGNLSRCGGVDVVSLGFDCFGRTVPTRWGLKRPRCFGERTGPFDLAVHTPEVVAKLLVSDFEGYMNPRHLRYDPSLGFCVDECLNICFNHERGPSFAESDFAALLDVYSRRVASFRVALQSPRPLLMVAHSPPTMGVYKAQLDSLNAAFRLLASRRAAPTRLLMIKTYEPDGGVPPVDAFEDDGFHFLPVPLPSVGYVWFEPACFLSDSGFAWEQSIVRVMDDVMRRCMLATAQPPSVVDPSCSPAAEGPRRG